MRCVKEMVMLLYKVIISSHTRKIDKQAFLVRTSLWHLLGLSWPATQRESIVRKKSTPCASISSFRSCDIVRSVGRNFTAVTSAWSSALGTLRECTWGFANANLEVQWSPSFLFSLERKYVRIPKHRFPASLASTTLLSVLSWGTKDLGSGWMSSAQFLIFSNTWRISASNTGSFSLIGVSQSFFKFSHARENKIRSVAWIGASAQPS